MLGADIANHYRCLQHDANDEKQLVSLGVSSFGHPIEINSALMDADLKVLTGFIEPHFFAGYSGGPKAILPGAAGSKTVFANHSPEMIAHPNADFNRTEGNPIWEEMKEAALLVPNTFLVNVTLDRDNRITGVFAGDVIAAHQAGCQLVQKISLFPIDKPYDWAVTSNSGYPLDQNLYQCVKGLAAAKRAVRKGGAILLLAACEEGLPDHGEYARLLKSARLATIPPPQSVPTRMLRPGRLAGPDPGKCTISCRCLHLQRWTQRRSDQNVPAPALPGYSHHHPEVDGHLWQPRLRPPTGSTDDIGILRIVNSDL